MTSGDEEDHDNEITPKDNKEDEDHKDDEDDEDNKDDKDHDNHDGEITSEDDEDDDDNDDDDDDNDDNEDVGAFKNKVEGGVPCASHSTLIKKLHILNHTPTYQCSIIKNEKIDLLIKKLLE